MASALGRRLAATCRAALLACGYYQRHDGSVLPIRAMADQHVIHALLAALRHGEPRPCTAPLAREVLRRRLRPAAEAACRRLERGR